MGFAPLLSLSNRFKVSGCGGGGVQGFEVNSSLFPDTLFMAYRACELDIEVPRSSKSP